MDKNPTNYMRTSAKLFYNHLTFDPPTYPDHSLHTHNAYELLYIVNGDVTHIVEDRKYKLKSGDLVIIPPLQFHTLQIDSGACYERYNILFDPDSHGIPSVKRMPLTLEVLNISNNRLATDIFRRLDIYFKNCDQDTFFMLLPHMLSELFYNLSTFPQIRIDESDTASPLISKALDYINKNLFTLKNVEEISAYLFVSESYFFRLFKSELHQTPKKYIMDKRLLRAQKMISEGEKPVAVCDMCGFGDYTTFYRNYTAFFGHSPSEERSVILK